jgi:galactokinase
MIQPFPAEDEQRAAATAALQTTWGIPPAAARCLFVAYRIVPLGAHVDHQGGAVLGRTLPTGTALAYVASDGSAMRLAGTNFSDTVTFNLGDPVRPDHWGRYAQAAALALGEVHPLRRGMTAVADGSLLGAGLGSSASVGLAYLRALADVNDILLSAAELVALDYRLEHGYLGLDNGIADQGIIVYGGDEALTYLDTRQGTAQQLPDPPGVAGSGWLIAFSGVHRELTLRGAFNQRVAESRAAANWLDPVAKSLGEVSAAQYAARAAEMPDTLGRRAAHYYGEQGRVREGLAAWPTGDLVTFGRLMDASCRSSIQLYESGHATTVALHQLMSAAPGVYGSRFSGGGHGGCVIGLAEGTQAEDAAAEILGRYRQSFSRYGEQAAIYWVPNGGAA